ncbi:MAG: alpha/beta hydrolase [Spirochaetes bacterium]|nr:alpha/beta hydrolase [Spirochaetota bacterium]
MNKATRAITAGIIVVLTVIALVAGAGYYFSGLLITPRVKGYDETYRIEISNKRFTEEFFRSLPMEEVFIQSPHGFPLHAVFIPERDSRKTVIFVHGHTFTLMGAIKYVELFRRRGFNCLLVDNRYHGKSGGPNSTFGFYERDDLAAWMDWILARTGAGSVIGFHGESLGSAICLMHAINDGRAAFYVLDGATADLEDLLAHKLKMDFGLPAFPLMNAASLVSKLRGAMFFEEVSPIRGIGKIKSPVLLIHGAADTFIPPDHSRRLYRGLRTKKMIWLCPGAEHSRSVLVDRAIYDRKIGEFFTMTGIR